MLIEIDKISCKSLRKSVSLWTREKNVFYRKSLNYSKLVSKQFLVKNNHIMAASGYIR